MPPLKSEHPQAYVILLQLHVLLLYTKRQSEAILMKSQFTDLVICIKAMIRCMLVPLSFAILQASLNSQMNAIVNLLIFRQITIKLDFIRSHSRRRKRQSAGEVAKHFNKVRIAASYNRTKKILNSLIVESYRSHS